jgi:predicted transcriptional regulator
MLKKGQPVAFSKPMSTMKRVFEAIEQDHQYKREIRKATGLSQGQVDSAIWNLKFIGVIDRNKDREGRYTYAVAGRIGVVAPCLCGVRSIFDVR